MTLLRDEIKPFPFMDKLKSKPIPGTFGIVGHHDEGFYAGTWPGFQSCREIIQLFFRVHHPGIWFVASGSEVAAIDQFMHWLEMTLVIPNKSQIHRSDHPDILYVAVSDWWRSCEMRKNAFTMFLRCARAYATLPEERRTYRNALLSYVYSRTTLPAIERFLCGFTRFTGRQPAKQSPSSGHITEGWYKTFKDQDVSFARTMLVAP